MNLRCAFYYLDWPDAHYCRSLLNQPSSCIYKNRQVTAQRGFTYIGGGSYLYGHYATDSFIARAHFVVEANYN